MITRMALEHALLVSLTERPGSGLELSRRFDRSIGLLLAGHATSRSTGRSARMEADGWLSVETVAPARQARQEGVRRRRRRREGAGRVDRRARTGRAVAQRPGRQACAVRRTAIARPCWTACASTWPSTRTRLAAYRAWCDRDYPDPPALTGPDLDQYLVLRGGIRLEEFWVDWLTEYLHAHEETP